MGDLNRKRGDKEDKKIEKMQADKAPLRLMSERRGEAAKQVRQR